MNSSQENKDYYYTFEAKIFKDLFSPEECHKIINNSDFISTNQATIGSKDDINTSVRNTIVSYFNISHFNSWIFNRISKVLLNANQYFYQFDLINFMEIQLLQYNEGGFYRWHNDVRLKRDSYGNHTSRKLSYVVFLSNPDDYDGGQLVLESNEKRIEMNQGSIVIFPSFIVHKVEPVTKGTRHTIAGWVHGPKFR